MDDFDDDPHRPHRSSSHTTGNLLMNDLVDPNARVRKWAGQFAQSAAHTVQELTSRKYALPDKNVASQLLMYRQLLHTKCRPGLKLSRDYQGTPAQQAVKHMPWWAQGCETTGKMVISYDNLVRRLWLHGAIFPYETQSGGSASASGNGASSQGGASGGLDTLLNEDGMPPVPHEYWVHRLGFQQQDPVTDFRSGGVLSLALMLHLAESCPDVFRRFVRPNGDASVLPFGITSINITDMLSKFLMLAKTVDRMDALLSQKPFWRMFADPNAITACQELAMDMLADVVVEFRHVRGKVTVFDFSSILAKTERRVQYDLLGAGPKSVAELYQVHAKVKLRYQRLLESESNGAAGPVLPPALAVGKPAASSPPQRSLEPPSQNETNASTSMPVDAVTEPSNDEAPNSSNVDMKDEVLHRATELASSATHLVGSVFSRMKGPMFNPLAGPKKADAPAESSTTDPTPSTPSEVVVAPPTDGSNVSPTGNTEEPSPASAGPAEEDEWVQADSEISAGGEDMNVYSIGDEEDDPNL